MPKEEVPTAVAYSIISILISFIPTLLFVGLHKSIDSINPLGFIVVTWLIVNVVSLLQVAVNAVIVLGYALLFIMGGDDDNRAQSNPR